MEALTAASQRLLKVEDAMKKVWKRLRGEEMVPRSMRPEDWEKGVMVALAAEEEERRHAEADMANVLEEVTRQQEVIQGKQAELAMLMNDLDHVQAAHHIANEKASDYLLQRLDI